MSATKWFHGTDSVAAEKIRIEGLRPNVDRFNMESGVMMNPIEWTETGFVFITPQREIAREYAILRSRYESALPNTCFNTGCFGAIGGEGFVVQKLGTAVHPDAKPVILELELKDVEVETDPHDPDYGFRVRGTIPPECIKKVHRVKDLA